MPDWPTQCQMALQLDLAMEEPLFFSPQHEIDTHIVSQLTWTDGGKDTSAADMVLKASLRESTHNK